MPGLAAALSQQHETGPQGGSCLGWCGLMRAKYARKLDAFCANAQCSGCAFCAARGESGDAGARAAALRPEEPPALVHIKGERVTAEDAARAAARRSFDAQQAQVGAVLSEIRALRAPPSGDARPAAPRCDFRGSRPLPHAPPGPCSTDVASV